MSSEKNLKGKLRVLKFLALNPGVNVSPLKGDAAEAMSLIEGEGSPKQRMLMTTAVLQRLELDGLVKVAKNQMSMTEVGRSWMKRHHAKNSNSDKDAFFAQHRDLVETTVSIDGVQSVVHVNCNESPLFRLRNRKDNHGQPWIDDAAFLAGERLRMHFTRAGLMQKTTSSWNVTATKSSGRGGKADITDQAVDARNRVREAIDFVGPELGGVLTDVCCFLKGLETVERERRWPPRSAKLMLKTGLNLLARFYGTSAGSGRRTSRSNAWMKQGARPNLVVET